MIECGLLQNRINELNSAIINFVETKVYISGFFNEARLLSHLDENKDNFLSKGVYDRTEVSYSNIKTDALFILQENGKTITKYKFIVILKVSTQWLKKTGSLIITIRKNIYADQWQVITENSFLEFDSKEAVKIYLNENFKMETDF